MFESHKAKRFYHFTKTLTASIQTHKRLCHIEFFFSVIQQSNKTVTTQTERYIDVKRIINLNLKKERVFQTITITLDQDYINARPEIKISTGKRFMPKVQMQLHVYHQVVLARKQQRDLLVFESNCCHLLI